MQQQSTQSQNSFGFSQQAPVSSSIQQQSAAPFQQNLSFATQKPSVQQAQSSSDPFSSFGDISSALPHVQSSQPFSSAQSQSFPARRTSTHSAPIPSSNDPFGSFGGNVATSSYSSAHTSLAAPFNSRAPPAAATTLSNDPFGFDASPSMFNNGGAQYSAPAAAPAQPPAHFAQAPNPFASPPPQSKPSAVVNSAVVNPFDLF